MRAPGLHRRHLFEIVPKMCSMPNLETDKLTVCIAVKPPVVQPSQHDHATKM